MQEVQLFSLHSQYKADVDSSQLPVEYRSLTHSLQYADRLF